MIKENIWGHQCPLTLKNPQQTNKTNATTQRNKYILERIYIPRCPCFLKTLWALLLSCLKLTTLDLVCIHIFTMYGITIGPVMPNLCIVVLWPPLAPFQMCQNWKMCRLSPVASDIPESKTNKKEVEIVGWPECEVRGREQHHVCQHVCSPSLDARIPGYWPVHLLLFLAHQQYCTSIVSYAFDLGTPTHESELRSMANDQLFVVIDLKQINNSGCVSKSYFLSWCGMFTQ